MSDSRWVKPVQLEGQSVTLVPMELDHASSLWAVAQDDPIWEYMPLQPGTPVEMEQFVAHALSLRQAGDEFPFVIRDNAGEIVGSTRYLDISPYNRRLEIGWTWLNPAVWRSRVNTECKYLLLNHAFETLGAHRVQLKTDLRNTRSQTAIERIGAQKEGVLRRHMVVRDGYIRDSVYFSVVDSEWPAVKNRVLSFLASDPTQH